MQIDNATLSYLKAKRIPFAFRTEYTDGKPGARTLMPLRMTKIGNFYRIGGKIVSRNMALHMNRQGLLTA